jgi:hypothetical protein
VPPTCELNPAFPGGILPGSPPRQQVIVRDADSGIAEIFDVIVRNGTVATSPSVPGPPFVFPPGTTEVTITATKTVTSPRRIETYWEFKVRDHAGNVRHCV